MVFIFNTFGLGLTDKGGKSRPFQWAVPPTFELQRTRWQWVAQTQSRALVWSDDSDGYQTPSEMPTVSVGMGSG